jgi:hypothetical protein
VWASASSAHSFSQLFSSYCSLYIQSSAPSSLFHSLASLCSFREQFYGTGFRVGKRILKITEDYQSNLNQLLLLLDAMVVHLARAALLLDK